MRSILSIVLCVIPLASVAVSQSREEIDRLYQLAVESKTRFAGDETVARLRGPLAHRIGQSTIGMSVGWNADRLLKLLPDAEKVSKTAKQELQIALQKRFDEYQQSLSSVRDFFVVETPSWERYVAFRKKAIAEDCAHEQRLLLVLQDQLTSEQIDMIGKSLIKAYPTRFGAWPLCTRIIELSDEQIERSLLIDTELYLSLSNGKLNQEETSRLAGRKLHEFTRTLNEKQLVQFMTILGNMREGESLEEWYRRKPASVRKQLSELPPIIEIAKRVDAERPS